MNFLISIIPAAVVLGVLIIIHELGHFIACRLTGVNVEKFSIGFGPEVLAWQSKMTRFSISLLPLGGYVKPAGESVSEVGTEGPKKGDYLAAPLWARIFIVVAGVIMNYALAFVLFTVIFMTGRPVPGTEIGNFMEGYPAKSSGLQTGDRIMQINGLPTKNWAELTDLIEKAGNAPLNLTVARAGETLPVVIMPRIETVKDVFGEMHSVKRLGIIPSQHAYEYEKYGFMQAIRKAWETEYFMTVTTHKAIFFLITGRMSMKAISGPIGIISMSGNAAQMGLPYVLQLMASLSVSLAVINLLPVPALDGGHLFFLLVEAVRRKQVSLAVQERATQVGFFLLLTLMVVIIYNDLSNIDAFEKIKGIFIKP